MQRAMDETTRRRKKQQAHNEANNITPKGVVKPIVDILDTDARAADKARSERKKPSLSASKIATKDTSGISKPSLSKLIPTNTSNTPRRKSRR
jgi:excinuclease UvrABC helicase subunit UvrB